MIFDDEYGDEYQDISSSEALLLFKILKQNDIVIERLKEHDAVFQISIHYYPDPRRETEYYLTRFYKQTGIGEYELLFESRDQDLRFDLRKILQENFLVLYRRY